MSVFNWYHSSIKHKIGGLFMVLLAFLLFMIVYSGYKIRLIENEMREVAYLDIPLSKIMNQVAFIELEQHLLFEQYIQEDNDSYSNLKQHQRLAIQKRNLKKLLDRAIAMIREHLDNKQLRLAQTEHQKVLASIEDYSQISSAFEVHLEYVISSDSITDIEKAQIEEMAAQLEETENNIIERLANITAKDAYYTEQHEEEFLFVSSLLGISAIILGLLLTIYITQILLRRIQRIQGDVKSLNSSLDSSDTTALNAIQKANTKDELAELEQDIKIVMSRLAEEINSREKMEQHLLALATQDKLTGAFNRHKWKEQIELQLSLAQRGSYQFSLILLDIDYFKNVNDQYGHLVGDTILQKLVKELQQRLRSTDMLFRIGGEEFTILLPMQDVTSTHVVAEELRIQIEQLKLDSLPTFTISIGISSYRENDDETSLFKRADMALYQAKAQGRNQTVQLSVDD